MDEDWFRGSTQYWSGVDASVNGMLGGLETLHRADIRDSKLFLNRFLGTEARGGRRKHALDVGAGIGRVSQNLLLEYAEQVSIIESDGRFVEQARRSLQASLHCAYNCRIQEYRCEEAGRYDLIWIQWVLMYASDEELLLFLGECRRGAKPGGLVGVKENVLSGDREPDIDPEDHSMVRSEAHFRRIFAAAGLTVLDVTTQTHFPASLYPVRMFMLVYE